MLFYQFAELINYRLVFAYYLLVVIATSWEFYALTCLTFADTMMCYHVISQLPFYIRH